ncbi:MFS transporter [Micromonospora sp. NPDC085948]|uniref:MFS transporter n=1 Tax=Micromonospora sp. NPDC085948 TaxID=3155293 RepID=UPI0034217A03
MTTNHADQAASTGAAPRQWLGLAVLALPTFVLSMDVTVLYLAVPHLAVDLRPNGTELLWITDIYGFMIAGFLVPMGVLGDRIGRRRLLLVGAAVFAAASMLAAYSTSTGMLIAARAVLGVAGATLMPSTLALLSNMFQQPRQRGTAIGIWAASLSAGVALGPLVGGALLDWFWWGAAFLIAVPVMVLLLIAGPWLLPEFRDHRSARMDAASIALFLAAVLPVVGGIKQLANSGATPVAVAFIACGLAAGLSFWRRQRRLSNPMVDVGLFRDRKFATTIVTLILGLASVAGVYLFVTVYLQYVADLSAFEAGLWLLLPAVAMTVTSLLAPRLAQRCSASVIVCGSLALSAIGFALITQLDAGSGPVPLLAGITVVYLGQGPIMALGTDLVVGAAPPRKAGAASALSETSVELGLALGVALLGSLGNAVYRQHLTVPDALSTAAAETARQSIIDAAAIAGQLPHGLAGDLTQAAREAFAISLNHVAVAAATTAGLLALLTITAHRHLPKR